MMKRVSALTQRELAASFFSPVAYIVAAVFLIATGYLFMTYTLVPGEEATLRPLMVYMAQILIFAIPLLTMRCLSDEFASGTIETLMTAPVTDTEVVLSKFLGAMVFYLALLLTTVLHVLLLFRYGATGIGVIFWGYIGMLMLGALYVSVGVFASALTKHQLVAAIIAIGILAVITLGVQGLSLLRGGAWRAVLGYVDVLRHFEDFSKGIVDSRAIIFFVSVTAFFLFLSVKVLESRRWR